MLPRRHAAVPSSTPSRHRNQERSSCLHNEVFSLSVRPANKNAKPYRRSHPKSWVFYTHIISTSTKSMNLHSHLPFYASNRVKPPLSNKRKEKRLQTLLKSRYQDWDSENKSLRSSVQRGSVITSYSAGSEILLGFLHSIACSRAYSLLSWCYWSSAPHAWPCKDGTTPWRYQRRGVLKLLILPARPVWWDAPVLEVDEKTSQLSAPALKDQEHGDQECSQCASWRRVKPISTWISGAAILTTWAIPFL